MYKKINYKIFNNIPWSETLVVEEESSTILKQLLEFLESVAASK